ncbi:MAG: AIR synthase related protein, partial [Caulobacterales bacterium]
PLFDDAPLYDRPHVKTPPAKRLGPSDVKAPEDYAAALLKLMACPDMASKRWLWEQYDRHVMADTLADSATGADAGIVRIHGKKKALAVTSDCTPRYVFSDPYEGGKQVVAEAWRNLTAVGADPIAITDNLNFGNPERPEIMGQIVGAIEGMAEACRELDFPVVSGNVSLYNETNGAAIPPTPTVGGVGLLPDYARRAGFGGMKPGDRILLVGETRGELGSSIYLRELHGREDGAPPPVDLALEKRTGDFVRGLIRSGRVSVVHDLSDGGLICGVADMALASGVGVSLTCDSGLQIHAELFGEDQARYLIAVPDAEARKIAHNAGAAGVVVADIGAAGGDAIAVEGVLSVTLADLRQAHEGWMPNYMAGLS